MSLSVLDYYEHLNLIIITLFMESFICNYFSLHSTLKRSCTRNNDSTFPTAFNVQKSSRLQLFFKIGVVKTLVTFAKFFKTLFSERTSPVAASEYLNKPNQCVCLIIRAYFL